MRTTSSCRTSATSWEVNWQQISTRGWTRPRIRNLETRASRIWKLHSKRVFKEARQAVEHRWAASTPTSITTSTHRRNQVWLPYSTRCKAEEEQQNKPDNQNQLAKRRPSAFHQTDKTMLNWTKSLVQSSSKDPKIKTRIQQPVVANGFKRHIVSHLAQIRWMLQQINSSMHCLQTSIHSRTRRSKRIWRISIISSKRWRNSARIQICNWTIHNQYTTTVINHHKYSTRSSSRVL